MSNERDIVKRFAADTAAHKLKIIREDGLYRHLTYGRPGSSDMRVDIVTWPGHLTYTGDMGTFVFSRVADMFTFFRGARINPGRWSKKLFGIDRDGVTEWSREEFRARATEGCWESLGDEEESVRSDFHAEVLQDLEDKSEAEAYRDIMEFEVDGEHPFQDWWEVDTKKFTHRYLWCCHAMVKIVALYDESRKVDSELTEVNSRA